jgi:WD40 repeat protein
VIGHPAAAADPPDKTELQRDFAKRPFVVISKDGDTIAVRAEDSIETIHLCSASTGAALQSPIKARDYVTGFALSPKGDHVAFTAEDGTIDVWDIRQKKRVTSISVNGRPHRFVEFADRRTKLVSMVSGPGHDPSNTWTVWDPATGNRLGENLK